MVIYKLQDYNNKPKQPTSDLHLSELTSQWYDEIASVADNKNIVDIKTYLRYVPACDEDKAHTPHGSIIYKTTQKVYVINIKDPDQVGKLIIFYGRCHDPEAIIKDREEDDRVTINMVIPSEDLSHIYLAIPDDYEYHIPCNVRHK